jgi:succinate dehydrogenase / fumarate reductase cytochrome b subunit
MRWSGIIILVFLVIHLANLTWGWFPSDVEHPHEFVPVYHNIVVSLSIPWLAAVYIIAQLALAVHLFHGAWSLFQSLGVNNPRFNGLRRGFAIGFAAVVCGVNISFPIAVLTGVVSN